MARIRFTTAQQVLLVAWMENEANYNLVYNHGYSNGVSNSTAYQAMADEFLRQLVLYPDRTGNLDVNAVDGKVVSAKWKAMVQAYSSCLGAKRGKKTGNGVNNDSNVLTKCKFFDKLQAIFGEDNPQFSPNRTRNGGRVNGARCVESYLFAIVVLLLRCRHFIDSCPPRSSSNPVPPPAMPLHLQNDVNELLHDEEGQDDGVEDGGVSDYEALESDADGPVPADLVLALVATVPAPAAVVPALVVVVPAPAAVVPVPATDRPTRAPHPGARPLPLRGQAVPDDATMATASRASTSSVTAMTQQFIAGRLANDRLQADIQQRLVTVREEEVRLKARKLDLKEKELKMEDEKNKRMLEIVKQAKRMKRRI